MFAVPFQLLSAQGNLQVVSNTAPTALSVGPLANFTYTIQNTGRDVERKLVRCGLLVEHADDHFLVDAALAGKCDKKLGSG